MQFELEQLEKMKVKAKDELEKGYTPEPINLLHEQLNNIDFIKSSKFGEV